MIISLDNWQRHLFHRKRLRGFSVSRVGLGMGLIGSFGGFVSGGDRILS